ncbi:MAG: terminase TerL endonuclease subunit [Pirellulales bacterium]
MSGGGAQYTKSESSEAKLRAGRLRHNGNPLLTWMAGRCAVRQDHNENIVPTKKDSTGRIDGIVASIIGLSRALSHEEQGPLIIWI